MSIASDSIAAGPIAVADETLAAQRPKPPRPRIFTAKSDAVTAPEAR